MRRFGLMGLMMVVLGWNGGTSSAMAMGSGPHPNVRYGIPSPPPVTQVNSYADEDSGRAYLPVYLVAGVLMMEALALAVGQGVAKK
jgi:hypothetical protein